MSALRCVAEYWAGFQRNALKWNSEIVTTVAAYICIHCVYHSLHSFLICKYTSCDTSGFPHSGPYGMSQGMPPMQQPGMAPVHQSHPKPIPGQNNAVCHNCVSFTRLQSCTPGKRFSYMHYSSLVPRPLPPRKKGPGIYCSHIREIIARMYGKGSVNVSVNGLSHMARS